MFFRRFSQFSCLIAMLACAGCGGSGLITLEGDVTVEGKPADDGSIAFSPADGKGATVGTKIQNGKFRLAGKNGVTTGKKKVDITATMKTGRKIAAPPPVEGEAMIDEIQLFSAKETCDVSENHTQPLHFDLKRSPAKK